MQSSAFPVLPTNYSIKAMHERVTKRDGADARPLTIWYLMLHKHDGGLDCLTYRAAIKDDNFDRNSAVCMQELGKLAHEHQANGQLSREELTGREQLIA